MIFEFANFAESRLAAPVISADVSLLVPASDAVKFPTLALPDSAFALVLLDGVQDPEICWVTQNSGTGTFVVLRGQEGTVAKNWRAGTAAINAPTATSLNFLSSGGNESWLDLLNARVDEAFAALAEEIGLRIEGDGTNAEGIEQLTQGLQNTNYEVTQISQGFQDLNEAWASYQTSVSAQTGDAVGKATQALNVATSLETGVQAKYGVALDADGVFAGFELLAGTGPAGPAVSSATFTVSDFVLKSPTSEWTPFVFDVDEGIAYLANIKVQGADIENLTVDFGQITDVVITTAMIEAAAIETALIADLAVVTAKIADLAVATGKIDDLAVTTGKIDDLAVTTAKIDNLAVKSAKIDDLAVTRAKIGLLAVGDAQIDDLAVTSAKIGDLQVDTIKIANYAVTDSLVAFTSGGVPVGSPTAGVTLLQSMVVNVFAGERVDFQAAAVFRLTFSTTVKTAQLRLKRNGVVIFDVPTDFVSVPAATVAVAGNRGFFYSETPGAGTFTYELEEYHGTDNSGVSGTIERRYLHITRVKR